MVELWALIVGISFIAQFTKQDNQGRVEGVGKVFFQPY